jgi:environmental stress-induced protein Ves
MQIKYVHSEEQARGSWTGGSTQTLAAVPLEAALAPANAQFWIGTATVERDAPYSYFPGMRRIHMPISGAGIRLQFGQPSEEVRLRAFEQYAFDGARPVQAALIDGPIVTFNVIARADVEVQLTALQPEARPMALDTGAALCVAYAVAGTTVFAPAVGDEIVLMAGDALILHGRARSEAAPLAVRASAPGTCLIIACADGQP